MESSEIKTFNHGTLLQWVEEQWPLTVRTSTEDTPRRLALPRPFITPCASEGFQDFYYWDTVFAGFGLLLTGHIDLVRDCCDNMLALIRRLGYVPNAAFPELCNRSQPPVAGFLVEAIAEFDQNEDYALSALECLDREYDFWMEKRLLACGLNHYGHNATEEYLLDFCNWCAPRIHCVPPEDRDERIKLGAHLLAEAESGWDFTSRFGHRALDYAPVDLNAILYANECRLARWHRIAGHSAKAKAYEAAAALRGKRMMELCYDDEVGCFFDYNALTQQRASLVSAAAYFPLWCGCPMDDAQANRLLELLKEKLWTPYGVMSCEKLADGAMACQWDWPNMWPPLQMTALNALLRYHRMEEAKELAKLFSECILNAANSTGKLWEKYSGLDGSLRNVNSEYDTPAMMGWTASSYIFCRSLLGDLEENENNGQSGSGKQGREEGR